MIMLNMILAVVFAVYDELTEDVEKHKGDKYDPHKISLLELCAEFKTVRLALWLSEKVTGRKIVLGNRFEDLTPSMAVYPVSSGDGLSSSSPAVRRSPTRKGLRTRVRVRRSGKR